MKREEWAYVIHVQGGHTKIGFSRDPQSRCQHVSTHHWGRVSLVAAFQGGYLKERELHGRFGAKHVCGEWFALDDKTLRDLYLAMPTSHRIGTGRTEEYVWSQDCTDKINANLYSRFLRKTAYGAPLSAGAAGGKWDERAWNAPDWLLSIKTSLKPGWLKKEAAA